MIAPLQILAEGFTGNLLNASIEGMVLAGLVWVSLRMATRQNSGTRFVVWFCALLAISSLPFLSATIFASRPNHPLANAHPQIVLASFVAPYLFMAWGAVASLLLLRLVIGVLRLIQVRRNCVAVDLAALHPEIAAVCRDCKSIRRATLCTSEEVTVPAAIGFFRPAVVFPERLFASLSTEEIKVILLHELAHLRRWDDWTNLAQKIVKAVFFFHPAVWWIDNHLTLEREMACDDVVLAETKSPKVYATSLISFTEKLQNSRRPALVQALVSRVRHMSLRVAQILSPQRPGNNALWKPTLGVSAALIATVLLATPFMPKVVAFRPDAPALSPQVSYLPAAPTAVAVHQARVVPARTTTRPRAIAASFHPREGVASQPKLSAATKPRVMLTRVNQNDHPLPNTVVILQTTRFASEGHEIWTLSVWRVGGNDWSDRRLESAWIVSSI